MLATFLGLEVIRRVSPLLHTPLMSLTNAISAISVVGAIMITGAYGATMLSKVLGFIAITAAVTNIVQRVPHHRPHAQDVQEAGREEIMLHLVSYVYIVASALFILSLKWMNSPVTARRSVLAGEVGMLMAIAGVLLSFHVFNWEWILAAFFIGTAVGIPSPTSCHDRGARSGPPCPTPAERWPPRWWHSRILPGQPDPRDSVHVRDGPAHARKRCWGF